MNTDKQIIKADKVLDNLSIKQREHAESYIIYGENKKLRPPKVVSFNTTKESRQNPNS